ncbi:MAG: type II toxin-antitoxin system prevent-host-death family antitoxin [Kiritimatiellae bacterium]|nr:type II toxin-antitoxin system prevent-host-death family antitoxin [Kiritimatiellia bacterium]
MLVIQVVGVLVFALCSGCASTGYLGDRMNDAACIHKVQRSKRPVVITDHGKSEAILIDVAEFEAMFQRLELLEDIAMGESMIAEGKGIPHAQAKKIILKRIS